MERRKGPGPGAVFALFIAVLMAAPILDVHRAAIVPPGAAGDPHARPTRLM